MAIDNYSIDTTIYFTVVNYNKNKINIVGVYLEHLTDSIYVNKPPGQSMKWIPRHKLGTVKLKKGERISPVLSMENTLPVEGESTESFLFDFVLTEKDNAKVDWKRSKLVVLFNSVDFDENIKIEQKIIKN